MNQPIVIQNQAFIFTHGLNLTECEKDIENVEKFSDLIRGERFGRIKEKKFYKETHDTWENYCQTRWQLTPQRVNQLIAFAETCQLFKSETQVSVLPENETQTRPLNQLPPEEKIAAWSKAVETTNGAQPNPEQVREQITRYCPNCLTQKIIMGKALKYPNNTIQCPQCQKHHAANDWLNASEKMLEEQKIEKAKQRTLKKSAQTRYCANCNHEQKIDPKKYVTFCPNCKTDIIATAWLTKPKEVATNTNPDSIKKYCPNCNHKQEIDPRKFWIGAFERCKHCKNDTTVNKWLTEPKPIYPETEINHLSNLSPYLKSTLNTLERVLADPGLRYELIQQIYEDIIKSEDYDLLGELAKTWTKR